MSWTAGRTYLLAALIGLVALAGVFIAFGPTSGGTGGSGSGMGATLDEGPWHIKIGGTEVGQMHATQPTGGPLTWNEYASRVQSQWSWVASGKIWEVSVSNVYGNGQPNCPSTAGTGGYDLCQVTSVTLGLSSSKTPSEYFVPDTNTTTNAMQVNAYHQVGRIEVKAQWTENGGTQTSFADYYVKVNADPTKRDEVICAQTTFKWPRRSKPSLPAVTWTMEWKDGSAAPANCPAGRPTRHTYTVDLI